MTDDQLIEKILDGDIQAFNTLVWRWQKPIYNFSLRFIGSSEEAKDITQKVFIKAYKNLNKLKDQRKFSSWLYQIALNLCRDECKKKRNHVQYSIEELEENKRYNISGGVPLLHEKSLNPEKSLERAELQRILQEALEQIPDEQKTVVILKELQGFKFTEIAEMLGLSVNTVKSRMYYGLGALRKILNQWQIDKEAIHYEV